MGETIRIQGDAAVQSSPSMPSSDGVINAINAIRQGEIVVVTDDHDRENEGDLICAASLCTPEKMAFIIHYCSGIVCTPLTASWAKRLNLTPMVTLNDAPLATAFTISVDYKHGLTTGISATERNNTVRALADGKMEAADFIRPGHVFPLIARDGGVLLRSGHTEAAVDLCRLAGLPEVAVICELVNEEGSVMRGAQVEAFAAKHNLKKIAVADLIAYRLAREQLVTRVAMFKVESTVGALDGFAYRTPFDGVRHFAFVQGEIGDGTNVPVRLHRAEVLGDVIAGGQKVRAALAKFKQEGRGILVYLRDGSAGVPANIDGAGLDDGESVQRREWREIGLGAQILRDLGVSSIRLRTPGQMKAEYVGLSGFGIEIVATEPLE